MLNFKIIYKIIGTLLFIEAGMMVLCMGLALYLGEDDSLAFVMSVFITILGGILFKYVGRDSDNSLGRREAYLLVTLTWIIFSFFGSLPFLISGYINDFTNAYFETISGFTTTGCSILDDVEILPHGLLFWRTMTQWIGGLGIVFFTIAIIPSLVGGNVKVFSAEATGPIRAKMHPRLSTTAKWIWSIYFMLTIGCAVCYYVAGMGLFDCMNYAMTTTATGGFSTHNASTGYFHNPYIDYTAIVFMFLSGTSFTLLYTTLFKGRFRQFFRNSEFRLYVFAVVVATAFITVFLIRDNHYEALDAIRVSLFQVTSFITTTGIFNDDAAHVPGCLLGVHQWRLQVHSYGDGVQHPAQRDAPHPASQGRAPRACQRQHHPLFLAGDVAGVPHRLYVPLPVHLFLHDSHGCRQHQFHYDRPELCQ